jgi:urease accessory protein
MKNIGIARLRVEHDGELSTVVDQFSQTPLQLHRPLYLEESSHPTVYIKTPSSGLLGGDAHQVDVVVGRNGGLELRTQAATLAYPGHSFLDVNINVADGGSFVYLPHALILGAGSGLTQRVTINLTGSASIDYSDSWCAGRIAMSEAWKFEFYDYCLLVLRDDVPAYRERWRITPYIDNLSHALMCADYTHFSSLYSFGPTAVQAQSLPSYPDWEIGENWRLVRGEDLIVRRCSKVDPAKI